MASQTTNMPLMVSISGIRGIVGSSLTPEVIVGYASAFAEYCKVRQPDNPWVVLGRDGRSTGRIIANLIASTLLSSGVNVRGVGIAPTPTIAQAVVKSGATGGISVTASHNPMEWNGMKFFSSNGLFLDKGEIEMLRSSAGRGKKQYTPWEKQGHYASDETWLSHHIYSLVSSGYLDMSVIQSRRFRVVVDCVNASGSLVVPDLLRELGCDVVELNCDLSGVFGHDPEPLPENLTALMERVKVEHAHFGVAVDPDGDRLALVTDRGAPFGEEYTVVAAMKYVLEREKRLARAYSKSVVVNLSTTRAVDDVAAEYGVRVFRSPVGELNVVKKMNEVGAILGGEGSGGVILPAIHPGRDAIVGLGLIVNLLAESRTTLSSLKESLPTYHIAKASVRLERNSLDEVIDRIANDSQGKATVNTDDGVKLDYPDHWVHLRKSNTEPIVRIIAESRTPEEAERILAEYKQAVLTA